jgi:pimeloyl-ACP methyl ester carboxylesterase
MFRWDATGALRKIAVPVLAIGGELDIVTKPEASRAIAATVVGENVTIVSEVNHMGFIERPEIYNDLIARFADRVQKPKFHPLRAVPRAYSEGQGTT